MRSCCPGLLRLGSIRSKRIAKSIERSEALALSDAELLEAWRDHPLERLKDWVKLLTLSSELFPGLGQAPLLDSSAGRHGRDAGAGAGNEYRRG